MNRAHFNVQITRLRTQWTSAYGEERVARIWKTFERVEDDTFTEMVNLALDKARVAPLADEFGAYEQEVKRYRAQDRNPGLPGGALGILERAARKNQTADPEYVQACLKHLRAYGLGEKPPEGTPLTREQFDQGCEMLNFTARQLEKGAAAAHREDAHRVPAVDQKTRAAGD